MLQLYARIAFDGLDSLSQCLHVGGIVSIGEFQQGVAWAEIYRGPQAVLNGSGVCVRQQGCRHQHNHYYFLYHIIPFFILSLIKVSGR